MKVERPRARSSPAPTRAEQAVHHAEAEALGRHEGARLGQDGEKRVLAQERRFAGHVRPGDDGEARTAHPAAVQLAVVGCVGIARPAHGGLDHRVAGGLGFEGEAGVDLRAHGFSLRRPFGQGRGDVQRGEGGGGGLDRGGEAHGLHAEHLERLRFDGEGAVGGLGDLGVEVGQFDGGEPALVGEGLAMDEDGVERRLEQGSAALALASTK